MSRPSVVAVINTFNRKSCLPDAVCSVFEQTVPVVKLVVIDDGSTDGTEEVMQALVAEAPVPLEYKRFGNAGLYPSRNRGLDAAEGDYVAFLDDDDVWHPSHIERCLELAMRFPEAVVIAGFIGRYGQVNPIMPAERLLAEFQLLKGNGEGIRIRKACKEINRIFFATHMSASLLKTSCAQHVRFDNNMKLRGDVLIIWKMACEGDIILDTSIHAWAKVVPNSLSSGIDKSIDPGAYHQMRAQASYWQAYALEKVIGERRRREAPNLYKDLGSALLGGSFHYRRSGQRLKALKNGIRAFYIYPSRDGILNLGKIILGL